MDYLKPFTYFAGATGGVVNTLLCAVCNLIPLVGPLVLLGYRAEVAEELARDRRLRRHPEFDFSRFGDYLQRGVWPFLYQLAAGAAAVGLFFACFFLGIAIGTATKQPALGLVAGLLVAVPLVLAVPALLWPLELHAQLSRRFAPVEAVGFAGRFIGRVWGQLLVSLVVFLAGSFALGVCGLLCFFVGIYLAVVVQFMAQQHLMTQLYLLYLDDGGEPIHGPDDEFDDD